MFKNNKFLHDPQKLNLMIVITAKHFVVLSFTRIFLFLCVFIIYSKKNLQDHNRIIVVTVFLVLYLTSIVNGMV